MAVYTCLSRDEIESIVSRFAQGTLVDFQEISAGIENSNYFLTTQNADAHDWVLTVFETLTLSELPYFIAVMRHVADAGLPSPKPCAMPDGESLMEIRQKPALLLPRLPGASVEKPSVLHCKTMGEMLARMHLAGQGFSEHRYSTRSLDWMNQVARQVEDALSDTDKALLERSVARYAQQKDKLAACPQGLIHGDLFRDNVLFTGDGELGGIIDFYHACTDVLLFDLAVVANDWVVTEQGSYDTERYQALLDGYRSVRPWQDEEHGMWPECLHLAALRFWLSRLQSRYGQGYQKQSTRGDCTKDPDEFKRILLNCA